MGTDIHTYTEYKSNGKWRSGDKWVPYPYKSDYEDEGLKAPEIYVDWKHQIYTDRNYNLFAILADVRNGVGFAGCDTGDKFNVIAPPRGLPTDMSPELKTYTDFGIEHTPTWVTLAELLAFDWDQTTKHRGWVDEEEFKIFLERGKPHEWSGDVSGRLIKKVNNDQMKLIIKFKDDERRLYNYYTQVEWEEPYRVSVANFLSTVPRKLETLLEVADNHDSKNVRLVMWFDS